jgi:hypothetical protein
MAEGPHSAALRRREAGVDWPHLAFATAIAGWCAWYCWDAWSATADVENLILILPATILVLVLYATIVRACVRARRSSDAGPVLSRKPLDPTIARKIAGTMAMLAALAILGPLVGFDVATYVYILAMLLLLGERRLPVLVLLPLLFCAFEIWGFNTILAIPLPMLLFHGLGS